MLMVGFLDGMAYGSPIIPDALYIASHRSIIVARARGAGRSLLLQDRTRACYQLIVAHGFPCLLPGHHQKL